MNKSNNFRRFLVLFSFGIAYGFMYVMPYMKSSFYDQMIAAMGVTNAQLGALMTYYTIALTISYLPGGWIGDRFKPKPVLLVSIFGQAILSFLFMVTYKSYTMAILIWVLMALTGGFAFWPSLMKGIRMLGKDEEQGRIYGIFAALNGVGSLILSFVMLGVMAVVGKTSLVTGFRSALAFMGGLSIVSGLLILFFFDGKATFGDPEKKDESASFSLRDFGATFKIPGVWIMSLLVWSFVTVLAAASYLTPYSTSVLGLSPALAASMGMIRTYGCRLVGGPLGGFIADKGFKSVGKEQIFGNAFCLVTIALFLFVPTGMNQGVLIAMILLVGVAMFTINGTMFSIQSELGIPVRMSATAINIATLIGYLPDMFVHTLFGKWLDQYGDAGYRTIFIYTIVTTAIAIVVAFIAVNQAKKVAARKKAEEESA